MSRSIVRRLTAVVVLAAALWMAAPAAAASRAFPTTPAVPQLSLLVKALTWLQSFLPAPEPAGREEKAGTSLTRGTDGTLEAASTSSNEGDISMHIDPNG